MGTRAVTNVVDEKGDVYVSLYRQFDGYPKGGHGEELADFLKGAEIGNGIGSNVPAGFFNGVGDLACRLVAFFRQDYRQIGSFYIIPPGTDWGASYTYTVTGKDPSYSDLTNGNVQVEVQSYDGSVLFSGGVEDFTSWVEEDNE